MQTANTCEQMFTKRGFHGAFEMKETLRKPSILERAFPLNKVSQGNHKPNPLAVEEGGGTTQRRKQRRGRCLAKEKEAVKLLSRRRQKGKASMIMVSVATSCGATQCMASRLPVASMLSSLERVMQANVAKVQRRVLSMKVPQDLRVHLTP